MKQHTHVHRQNSCSNEIVYKRFTDYVSHCVCTFSCTTIYIVSGMNERNETAEKRKNGPKNEWALEKKAAHFDPFEKQEN